MERELPSLGDLRRRLGATAQNALDYAFDPSDAFRQVVDAGGQVPNVCSHVAPDGYDDSYDGGPYSEDSNQLRRHRRVLGLR